MGGSNSGPSRVGLVIPARTIGLIALGVWGATLTVCLVAFWDADLSIVVVGAVLAAAVVAVALGLINAVVAANHRRQARAFGKAIDAHQRGEAS